MHFLLLILIVVAVFFILRNKQSQGSLNQNDKQQNVLSSDNSLSQVDSTLLAKHNLAYLSKGKLFSKSNSNQLEEVHSTHIQNLLDRAEKKNAQHGWKQGTSWGTTPVGGVRQFEDSTLDVEFTAAAMLPNNRILYFLKGAGFGGLFRYDLESKEELRLAHRQSMDYKDLHYDAKRNNIICTSVHASGVSNILLMDEEGDNARELTGGDTEDVSPCWLPDGDKQIVFQSMGLARNSDGYVIARGPSSIQLLDSEKGEVTPVLESDEIDYIDPKVSTNGDLFFIRRPYELPQYKTSNFIVDTLMFPFRLLRALFHYLNFFSLMYSREPLTSASSPYVEADMKEIMLKGKRINAEEALKRGNNIHGVPSLVPKNWELVRRDKQGSEKVIANSVLSYVIADDDQLIYSNGSGAFLISDNQSQLLFKDALVTDIIA